MLAEPSYNKRTGEFNSPVQYAFCMFVLAVLAAAAIMLLISLIRMAVRKNIRQDLFSFVFSVVLLLLSSACICRMILEIRIFNTIGEVSLAEIYEKTGVLIQNAFLFIS